MTKDKCNSQTCAINSRLKHHWTDRALNIKQLMLHMTDESLISFIYTSWHTQLKPDQQKQTFTRQFYKSLYVQQGTANENAPNRDTVTWHHFSLWSTVSNRASKQSWELTHISAARFPVFAQILAPHPLPKQLLGLQRSGRFPFIALIYVWAAAPSMAWFRRGQRRLKWKLVAISTSHSETTGRFQIQANTPARWQLSTSVQPRRIMASGQRRGAAFGALRAGEAPGESTRALN